MEANWMHSESHSLDQQQDTQESKESMLENVFKSRPNSQSSRYVGYNMLSDGRSSSPKLEEEVKREQKDAFHMDILQKTENITHRPSNSSIGPAGIIQVNAKTRAKILQTQRDAVLRRRKIQLQSGQVIKSNVHHDVTDTSQISLEKKVAQEGGRDMSEVSSEFRSPNGHATAHACNCLIETNNGCKESRINNNCIHMMSEGIDTSVHSTNFRVNNVEPINNVDSSGVIDVNCRETNIHCATHRERKVLQWRDATVPDFNNDADKIVRPIRNSKLRRNLSNLSEMIDSKAEIEMLTDEKLESQEIHARNFNTADDIDGSNLCDWNDSEQMKNFLMAPCPKAAGIIKCYIKRGKRATTLFPEYSVHLKNCDTFLMSSKKRPNKKSSNYLISINKKDGEKNSHSIIGKLRSNFLGTEFQVFDAGQNPKRLDSFSSECKNDEDVRTEFGAIIYASNIMGNRGPRKMRLCLNTVDSSGRSTRQWQPMHEEEGMLQCFKHKSDMATQHLTFYENRQPRWNEEMGAYVLNFNGRVTMASVKNFQIIEEGSSGESLVLQFGRAAKNEFAMDVQYPMSLFQAFAIILSACDSKIACD